MKPKEKANSLCMGFLMNTHTEEIDYGINKQLAKQCALIAVDEILKVTLPSNYQGYDTNDESLFGFTEECHTDFWQEVKQEIEKIV